MDRLTLINTALVCARWYPRAMRNLYYTVLLLDRTSFDLLARQSRRSSRVKKWLATTHELVAVDTYSPFHDRSQDKRRYLHALPLALGRAMSGVQVLEVGGFHPFMRPDSLRSLEQFNSVRSLDLTDCALSNLSQLRRIISSFPQLTDLALRQRIISPRHPDSPQVAGTQLEYHSQSDIRILCLVIHVDRYHEESYEAIINWLVFSGICTSLNDLTISWIDKSSLCVASVDGLLNAAGPSLRRYSESASDSGQDYIRAI
ncbi:uncharacterized protein B0H18DRAFT_83952 [Fomitopsis serialis]|uniref:uncharacterized protein n=1 Tax=Fomitopsis serialis TaxID=139415 RepID=UPI00200832B6|nr:uncharacterized protein B0H18DRAFT_83952 [Neoantrodia serialis]KAH9931437.1 hypothetical protein B0H18DRAFT_83952 [Neoantrodia serialis]